MTLPQLRVRTEFTFRSTFAPVALVAARLSAIGAPAAGIVDPGTWGHTRWEAALKGTEVKPLYGREFVVRADGRRPVAWALAEDTRAFYRFSSAVERMRGDTPFDPEVLAQRSGFIVFAGAALKDPALFDYVDMNPASPLQQQAALALHRRTGKPLVVTSDNAYPAPEHHDAFLALTDRQKLTPQWILTEEELRAQFPILSDQEWEKARLNTFEAAERASVAQLQRAPLIHVKGDLRALAEEGRQERLRKGHIAAWTPEYAARLEHELKIIAQKDFESYFLVVSDLIRWAKQRMLVGPGRGSSAGSLLCYLIGITEVDPIVHRLLFERFIDITRNDLPDIDIDFNDRKRDQCFQYLADKYGAENVARIGNVNTLKARSAMAEVGKRLGIPKYETFPVANVLIEYSSGDSRYGKALEDTLKGTEAGQTFMRKYPEADLMSVVEGHAWHTGIHAAGVIVSNEPVSDYCTVTADGVAQIDKPAAERLNLLKIDALGLKTLGVIEDAGVVSSEELYALKLDDPNVLRVFDEGKFRGIFQFEGDSQNSISQQLHFDAFETIDHATALARPGPLGGGASNHYILRKAGKEPVTYRHPMLEPILRDTYGVVLYQEQVMRIAREIGKFSWEDVAIIRKTMSGRKGKEFFDRYGKEFVKGAAQDNIPQAEAEAIWDEICTFGAWGMNRCVAEDTRIKLCHPNQFLGPNPTIGELYYYYKTQPSNWVRQRKAMPVLLSLEEDGIARPRMAVDIVRNGAKRCLRLSFANGETVECTAEHKFIINGRWQQAGEARIGDFFAKCRRERHIKPHTFSVAAGRGWRRGRQGAGAKDKINGRSTAQRAFALAMTLRACEDCCQHGKRMEVHHNDHKHGLERPTDLAWLCSSCHKKRHMAAGDWLPPYARGWSLDEGAQLVEVKSVGMRETYDIEMPEPYHNYVLANGIVTHNSHTVAYAVISYWCAWMKAYHPLEYAAACLRGETEESAALALLRELDKEGIKAIPFDIDRSDVDWSVVDGQLLGGFKNLVGYGPAKAVAAVEQRRLGQLDREKVLAATVRYQELYPLHAAYGDWYKNPQAHGIAPGWPIVEMADMKDSPSKRHPYEYVLLCTVVAKERRDDNETVRVQRRGGKLVDGPSLFLDIAVIDDSSKPHTLRVDRWNYEPLGRLLFERLVPGDVLLVRGVKIVGFPMIKSSKIRCLTNPRIFDHAPEGAEVVGSDAKPQAA